MLKLLAVVAVFVSFGMVHDKGVLTVLDRRFVAGDTARVSGAKFSKAANVRLFIVGAVGRTHLLDIRTDTAGRFRVAPLIPSGLAPGVYRLIVSASDGDEVGALDVEIVPRAQQARPMEHTAHADSMMEPSARPLDLQRARSPLVTGGALAGIAVALILGLLLLRRPNGAVPGLVLLLLSSTAMSAAGHPRPSFKVDSSGEISI